MKKMTNSLEIRSTSCAVNVNDSDKISVLNWSWNIWGHNNWSSQALAEEEVHEFFKIILGINQVRIFMFSKPHDHNTACSLLF